MMSSELIVRGAPEGNRALSRLRASWRSIGLTTALLTMVDAFDAYAVPLTPFRYEAQAQRHCPADTVVWLDFASKPTIPGDRNATHAVWTEVLSAEARLAPAVTGALCSAFDSRQDEVAPAGSDEQRLFDDPAQ